MQNTIGCVPVGINDDASGHAPSVETHRRSNSGSRTDCLGGTAHGRPLADLDQGRRGQDHCRCQFGRRAGRCRPRGQLDVLPLTEADSQLAVCVQPELERIWELIGDSHCTPGAGKRGGRRHHRPGLHLDGRPAGDRCRQPALPAGVLAVFCVSVPLRGVNGELLGALDLTGSGTRNAGIMLERLKHAALATENNFFLDLPNCRILELHHDPRLLGAPLQAVLAVQDDGTVYAANRAAQQLLGVPCYRCP